MNPPAEPGLVGRAARFVLDLIYPPQCAICREPLNHGRSLCAECHADFPRLRDPFCRVCGEMFSGKIDDDFECPNCGKLSFAFDFARPALPRDDRLLTMIHRLKYHREIHLAAELATLAAEAFRDPRLEPSLAGAWPLIPVPLHRSRLRHRHFNQAAEICRALSRHTGLPALHALRRVRRTDTQTMLSRHQRLENLRGAFEITRRGRQWTAAKTTGAILVDDVFTTGSTVHECARVLRKAGFRNVAVVTVMRG